MKKEEIVKIKKEDFLPQEKWNILKSPCITEKAVNISSQGNFYVFHVNQSANKIEIKKAIEDRYKVNVIQVRTINIPRKKIKKGRIEGFKNSYKKAIVKVKENQKIEMISQ
jgi:large subunit ribosomal protein L23